MLVSVRTYGDVWRLSLESHEQNAESEQRKQDRSRDPNLLHRNPRKQAIAQENRECIGSQHSKRGSKRYKRDLGRVLRTESDRRQLRFIAHLCQEKCDDRRYERTETTRGFELFVFVGNENPGRENEKDRSQTITQSRFRKE